MKRDYHEHARALTQFIDASPTAFHAAKNIEDELCKTGFIALDETQRWKLEPGKGYFVSRNETAVIAFIVGGKKPCDSGFRLIGAHTDSPSLKIKPASESISNYYVKVGVEVYGGPIVSTWLDRELGIAGRVFVRAGNKTITKLFDSKAPVAIIPNAAIHMNRDINKGFEYNRQTHLPALLSISETTPEDGALNAYLADQLSVPAKDIVDYELYLYEHTPACITGIKGDFITAGRLDDLAMSHGILTALCTTHAPEATVVGTFFDNEEIGSQTLHGADSQFLRDTLERVNLVSGGNNEDLYRAYASSFMISADMAHALHPNYSDKHDSAYAPIINKGPVIKANANYRYATTAASSIMFEELCEKAGVPCQKLIPRSDSTPGSTIGPMTSARMGIPTVDVGNPMWAMHSIRETAGVKDHAMMTEVFITFFKS